MLSLLPWRPASAAAASWQPIRHIRVRHADGHLIARCLVALVAVCGMVVAQENYVMTVAGIQTNCGLEGNNGPASSAQLCGCHGVALDFHTAPDSWFLIADSGHNAIRRVTTTGVISVVAGGNRGYSGDGGPATEAAMIQPLDVKPYLGGFLIAESDNNNVRRVFANGTMVTAAGNGASGYSGEGVQASGSSLISAPGVSTINDGQGGFLIAEGYSYVVRRVFPNGTMFTVAGTPLSPGYSGDGGPATAAQLNVPWQTCPDASTGYFITDEHNCCVRHVNGAGIISTYAGQCTGCGFSGDGGPATLAQMGLVTGLAFSGRGLVVVDFSGSNIRLIDANGIISTLAGRPGEGGYADGPALSARFASPIGITHDGVGGYLVAELDNSRIRRIMRADMWGRVGVAPPFPCALTASMGVAVFMCNVTAMTPYLAMSAQLSVASGPCSTTVAAAPMNGNTTTLACPASAANGTWNPSANTLSWSTSFGASASAVVLSNVASVSVLTFSGFHPLTWNATILLQVMVSSGVAPFLTGVHFMSCNRTDVVMFCDSMRISIGASNNTANVSCALPVPVESWLDGCMQVRLILSGAPTRNYTVSLPRVGALPFQRPAFRNLTVVSGPWLAPSGGSRVLITFTRTLPLLDTSQLETRPPCIDINETVALLLDGAVRGTCVRTGASDLDCSVAAGSELLARVSVVVCGLFAVTSDGAAPAALLNTSLAVRAVNTYASYDPSIAFVTLPSLRPHTADPTALIMNTTVPLTSATLPYLPQLVVGAWWDAWQCSSIVWNVSVSPTLTCIRWQLSQPLDVYTADIIGVFTVPVELQFRGVRTTLQHRYNMGMLPTVSASAPSAASANTSIIVLGSYLTGDNSSAVSVYIGNASLPCWPILLVNPNSITCRLPRVIPSWAPGFPTPRIVVISNRGQSLSTVSLALILDPAVAFTSPQVLYGFPAPSGATAPALMGDMLTRTHVDVAAFAVGATQVVCTAFIVSSTCPAVALPRAGASAGQTISPALVGVTTQLAPTPAGTLGASLTFAPLGLHAALGCSALLALSCIDVQTRVASTAVNVTLQVAHLTVVYVPNLRTLVDSGLPYSALPTSTLPQVTWSIATTNASYVLPGSGSAADALAWLSCSTALFPAAAPPGSDVAVLGTATGVLVSATCAGSPASHAYGGVNITITCSAFTLPSWIPFDANYTLVSQCMYTRTAEVLRLPPLTVVTPAVNVTLGLCPGSSALVDAYTSIELCGNASMRGAGVSFAEASGVCSVTLVSTTAPSLQLAPSTLIRTYAVLANGSIASGRGDMNRVLVELQGPPNAVVGLRLDCVLWGSRVVSSEQVTLTVAPFLTRVIAINDSTVEPASSLVVAPSAASGATEFLAALPPVRVLTTATVSATCTASIDTSSSLYACSSVAVMQFGVGMPTSTAPPRLVGGDSVTVASISPGSAPHVNVTFSSLGVFSPGNCSLPLTIVCQDGVGRRNQTASLLVRTAAITAVWEAATAGLARVPPAPLPPLQASLLLCNSEQRCVQSSGAWWSCVAVLIANTTSPSSAALALPLSSQRTIGVSAVDGVVSTDGASVIVPNLDGTLLTPNGTAVVHAECSYTPTGERVRLPPLILATFAARLDWVQPAPTPLVGNITMRRGVLMRMQWVLRGSAAPATLTCSWTSPQFASGEVRLGNDAPATFVVTQPVLDQVYDAWLSLLGAPAAAASVTIACAAWPATTLTAPLLPVRIAPLHVAVHSAPSPVLLPSSIGQPLPARPRLVVQLEELYHNISDDTTTAIPLTAACTLSSRTPGVGLVVERGANATLLSVGVPSALDLVVSMPLFGVSAPSSGVPAALLELRCFRTDSGDAAPPTSFDFTIVQSQTQLCTMPTTTITTQTIFNPFAVRIIADTDLAVVNSTVVASSGLMPSCGDDSTSRRLAALNVSLDLVLCSVIDARAVEDTTSPMLLQGNNAFAAQPSYVASFEGFSITAPPAAAYPLLIRCSYAGVPVAPDIRFDVAITGCPAGTQVSDIFCQRCGAGTFSLGTAGSALHPNMTRCRGCPPTGAVCDGGLITMLPHFYRPKRHVEAGHLLGPDTELHACLVAEACQVFNATWPVTHACAPGYTGVLCGVCDMNAGYGRFGNLCQQCWNTDSTRAFVGIGVVVLTTLATYIALRRSDTPKTRSAIALKILVSFVQYIGSLRSFRAGGTALYHAAMGWSDTVAASPLRMAAFDCLWRPPFLATYASTVALPLIAAVAVILIFVTAMAIRSTQLTCTCNSDRGSCAWDARSFKDALRQWLREGRHGSTLLFMLFLGYMAIISSSLRVLDCTEPIDGVRWVRSDLRVPCYEGEHAVALLISYCMLCSVGVGFPVVIFVVMLRASPEQLRSPRFRLTWQFLYSGYRGPHTSSMSTDDAAGNSVGAATSEQSAGVATELRDVAVSVDDDSSALSPGAAKSGLTARELRTAATKKPSMRFSAMNPVARVSEAAKAQAKAGKGSSGAAVSADNVQVSTRSSLTPLQLEFDWAISDVLRHPLAAIRALLLLMRTTMVWYEALVLVRKSAIVLLAVLVSDPYLQLTGAILVFTVSLIMHMFLRPYADDLFNNLELLSITAACVTAIASVNLLTYDVTSAAFVSAAPQAMTPVEWMVSCVLIVMNMTVLAVLSAAWIHLWILDARRRAATAARVVARAVRRISQTGDKPLTSVHRLRSVATVSAKAASSVKPGVSPADGGQPKLMSASHLFTPPLRLQSHTSLTAAPAPKTLPEDELAYEDRPSRRDLVQRMQSLQRAAAAATEARPTLITSTRRIDSVGTSARAALFEQPNKSGAPGARPSVDLRDHSRSASTDSVHRPARSPPSGLSRRSSADLAGALATYKRQGAGGRAHSSSAERTPSLRAVRSSGNMTSGRDVAVAPSSSTPRERTPVASPSSLLNPVHHAITSPLSSPVLDSDVVAATRNPLRPQQWTPSETPAETRTPSLRSAPTFMRTAIPPTPRQNNV